MNWSNKIINVAFSSNDWYAEHLAVAIFSLLKNLDREFSVKIYILDWGISKKNKKFIENIVDKLWNWTINFIEMDREKYKNFPTIWRLSQETYYRLEIPDLIQNIDKIIYLDVDIIIDWPLNLLRETDLSSKAIWATKENTTINYYRDLYDLKSPYKYHFNAWILLIDVNKIRHINLMDKVIDFMEKNKDLLVACDQDALNVILNNEWTPIHPKYNALPFLWVTNTWKNFWYPKDEFKEAKDNPIIIHFAWEKPWKKTCFHPKAYLYHQYRKECWLPPIKLESLTIKDKLKQFVSKLTLVLQANIPNWIYRYFIYKPYRFLLKRK